MRARAENTVELVRIMDEKFATKTLDEWDKHLP